MSEEAAVTEAQADALVAMLETVHTSFDQRIPFRKQLSDELVQLGFATQTGYYTLTDGTDALYLALTEKGRTWATICRDEKLDTAVSH